MPSRRDAAAPDVAAERRGDVRRSRRHARLVASFQPSIYEPPASGTIRRRSSSSASGWWPCWCRSLGHRASSLPSAVLQPLASLGRSSLFVYWIHIEMVYGVIAEPLKQQLPLWASITGTALLTLLLYCLVLLKNRCWSGTDCAARARARSAPGRCRARRLDQPRRSERDQVGHLRHQRAVDHGPRCASRAARCRRGRCRSAGDG